MQFVFLKQPEGRKEYVRLNMVLFFLLYRDVCCDTVVTDPIDKNADNVRNDVYVNFLALSRSVAKDKSSYFNILTYKMTIAARYYQQRIAFYLSRSIDEHAQIVFGFEGFDMFMKGASLPTIIRFVVSLKHECCLYEKRNKEVINSRLIPHYKTYGKIYEQHVSLAESYGA